MKIFGRPMSLRAILQRRFARNNKLISKMARKSDILEAIAPLKPVNNGFALRRIGGEADGAYLVPDDFEGISGCFSPGVGDSASFEEAVIREFNVPCFLADYSVEKPPIANPMIDFERKFIGSLASDAYMTLDDWVKRKSQNLPAGSDLILQMDIEGWEYDTLIHLEAETLKRFRIIVLELHRVDGLYFEHSIGMYASLFRKLTEFHDVVHLHPNNGGGTINYMGLEVPRLMEVTLHRKDRSPMRQERTDFPHPLDRANLAHVSDIVLPTCWYR